MDPLRLPIGASISAGWDQARRRLGFWIGYFLVYGLVAWGVSSLQEALKWSLGMAKNLDLVILVPFLALGGLTAAALWLLGLLVNNLMGIGMVRTGLKAVDGDDPRLFDLFSGLDVFWRYLGATILYMLIFIGGLCLLVVPGIIWAIKFQYYGYFIADPRENCGVMESLRRSARLTQGAKGQLLLFDLALIGVILLGFACLFVGIFAAAPTALVASAWMYRRLQALRDGDGVEVLPPLESGAG